MRVPRFLMGAIFTFGTCLTASLAQANPFPPVTWHCYRNDAVTVLGTDKDGEVGSKFLVRKSTNDLKADCAIEDRASDLVLGTKSTNGSWEAYSYIALVKKLLVLDNGSGPDSALVIYDLPGGNKVLDTGYSIQGNCNPTTGCQSDEFQMDETGLTFWRQTKEAATAKNCPKFAEYMKSTGAAAIEQKATFKFATLKVDNLSGKRCVPRQ